MSSGQGDETILPAETVPAVVQSDDDRQRLAFRRRAALRLILGAGVAGVGLGADAWATVAPVPQFLHGVASGDPLPGAVILWTRVTPPGAADLTVTWRISRSPTMAGRVQSGTATATAASDFTVKIDVAGLKPDTQYWYQFRCAGVASPIGRTRTAPAAGSLDPMRFAVFSCSIFEKGFFNAYAEAARHDNLRACLHLGDWNYEYGVGRYVTPALLAGLVTEPRSGELVPTTDTVWLDAYRARKALYRTDEDLQALSALHPWITIWDDHESANDSWTGGAENHDPATQGPWQDRKAAAIQAYYEWIPIREPAAGDRIDPVTGNPAHMYRSFDFGDVVRLIMLDSRMAGREQQFTPAQMAGVYQAAAATGSFAADVDASGAPRTLLGTPHEQWFDDQITASRQTWQLVGNQTLLHFQIAPDFLGTTLLTATQKAQLSALLDALFGPGGGAFFGALGSAGGPNPATYDSWNGYPSARQRFYGSLAKAANPVVLSGDSHNAWAAELKIPTPAGRIDLGVEFGGTSVTSPGYEQTFIGLDPAVLAELIVQSNAARSQSDRLVYADTSQRGFMLVHASPTHLRTDYVYLSTIVSRSYTTTTTSFTVKPGARRIARS